MDMSVCILYSFSPTGDFNRLIPGPIAWEGKCDKIAVGEGRGGAVYWGRGGLL
jgi:hypothetical protein